MSNLEDQNPLTVYDFSVTPGHNIEAPVPNGSPNDNRDENKSLAGNPLLKYPVMQANCLSATSALTQRAVIGGVVQYVAEVTLTVTDRFAGDNYVVRATTVDPGNGPFGRKPFNMMSLGDPYIPSEFLGTVPADRIKQSATLAAWKRVYYEEDWMYRWGSLLNLNAPAGQNVVFVKTAAPLFAVGDRVRVIDSQSRESELATITSIDPVLKALVLDRNLANSYATARQGFVGIETGNNPADFYIPDTSALPATFNDVYTEVIKVYDGSEPVPLYPKIEFDQMQTLRNNWFANQGRSNHFLLVGAADYFGNTPLADITVGQTQRAWNSTFIFHVPIGPNPELLRSTVNHEMVHQFDYAADVGGHNNFLSHDNSDWCLMNNVNRRQDVYYELSLDRIYYIRDKANTID